MTFLLIRPGHQFAYKCLSSEFKIEINRIKDSLGEKRNGSDFEVDKLLLLHNARGHSDAIKARRGGSKRSRAQKNQKGTKDRG